MIDKYQIIPADVIQKLEEFRVIEGITDESHPVMQILKNSHKIHEGELALETVDFYKNIGINKTIALLNEEKHKLLDSGHALLSEKEELRLVNAQLEKGLKYFKEVLPYVTQVIKNINELDEDKLVECLVDFSGNGDIDYTATVEKIKKLLNPEGKTL